MFPSTPLFVSAVGRSEVIRPARLHFSEEGGSVGLLNLGLWDAGII